MTKKPTYNELEQRARELEKALDHRASLEEKLKLLSMAVEQSSEGIAVSDLNGDLQYLNHAFAEMHGYLPEELVGKNLSIFHAPEQIPSVEAANLKLKQTGDFKGEIWHVRRDGTVFPTMMHNSLVRDNAGNPVGMMGTLRDIGDIKQSEKALRESGEKYRQLFVNASIGIGIADENGKIIDFNNAMLEPGGYSWQDISKINNIVELYYDPVERDRILALAQRQGFVDEVAVQFKRKDGTPYDALLSLRPVKINGASCWQAMVQDITMRKKAEEALQQSEDRYRSLVEGQTELICRYTSDWKLTFVNEAYCRYFDKQPEELIGDSFMKFLAAEDQQKVTQEHHALLSSGLEHAVHEHQVIDGKGAIRWQQWVVRAVYDRDGLLIEYQSVGRDITDRRKAEEALKESEQALKKAHDELERRVEERTQELEIKTKSLEELNTAMKVLLKKREEDKLEIENNVLTNAKELIAPYLDKIKTTQLDDQQKTFLSIIESNMNEIISPFTRQLSLKYLKLTPTEIKIANMIKHGHTTKKIAAIMNISPRTVDAHRKNIRTKIGLKKKRANLRSHLLSMH